MRASHSRLISLTKIGLPLGPADGSGAEEGAGGTEAGSAARAGGAVSDLGALGLGSLGASGSDGLPADLPVTD